MIYLITAQGDSGNKFSIWFECEDTIDCEVMMRDCGIDGDIEGTLMDVEDAIEQGYIERVQ